MCKIYYFNSTDITNGYQRLVNNNVQSANRRMTSCFQSTTTLYIFCFYQNIEYNFIVIVYQSSLKLEKKLEATIDSGESRNGNEYIFFKGIYLFVNIRKCNAFDPADWLFWSKDGEIKSGGRGASQIRKS